MHAPIVSRYRKEMKWTPSSSFSSSADSSNAIAATSAGLTTTTTASNRALAMSHFSDATNNSARVASDLRQQHHEGTISTQAPSSSFPVASSSPTVNHSWVSLLSSLSIDTTTAQEGDVPVSLMIVAHVSYRESLLSRCLTRWRRRLEFHQQQKRRAECFAADYHARSLCFVIFRAWQWRYSQRERARELARRAADFSRCRLPLLVLHSWRALVEQRKAQREHADVLRARHENTLIERYYTRWGLVVRRRALSSALACVSQQVHCESRLKLWWRVTLSRRQDTLVVCVMQLHRPPCSVIDSSCSGFLSLPQQSANWRRQWRCDSVDVASAGSATAAAAATMVFFSSIEEVQVRYVWIAWLKLTCARRATRLQRREAALHTLTMKVQCHRREVAWRGWLVRTLASVHCKHVLAGLTKTYFDLWRRAGEYRAVLASHLMEASRGTQRHVLVHWQSRAASVRHQRRLVQEANRYRQCKGQVHVARAVLTRWKEKWASRKATEDMRQVAEKARGVLLRHLALRRAVDYAMDATAAAARTTNVEVSSSQQQQQQMVTREKDKMEGEEQLRVKLKSPIPLRTPFIPVREPVFCAHSTREATTPAMEPTCVVSEDRLKCDAQTHMTPVRVVTEETTSVPPVRPSGAVKGVEASTNTTTTADANVGTDSLPLVYSEPHNFNLSSREPLLAAASTAAGVVESTPAPTTTAKPQQEPPLPTVVYVPLYADSSAAPSLIFPPASSHYLWPPPPSSSFTWPRLYPTDACHSLVSATASLTNRGVTSSPAAMLVPREVPQQSEGYRSHRDVPLPPPRETVYGFDIHRHVDPFAIGACTHGEDQEDTNLPIRERRRDMTASARPRLPLHEPRRVVWPPHERPQFVNERRHNDDTAPSDFITATDDAKVRAFEEPMHASGILPLSSLLPPRYPTESSRLSTRSATQPQWWSNLSTIELKEYGRKLLREYKTMRRSAVAEVEELTALQEELDILAQQQQQQQFDGGKSEDKLAVLASDMKELQERCLVLRRRQLQLRQLRAKVQQLLGYLESETGQSLMASERGGDGSDLSFAV